MFFLLILLLPEVRSQETTPSSYLGPSNYNYHPFQAVQFVKAKPTKKGPILFPNDAPPPPPTPLIVTARPLSESIARSELNPNNSLGAQSQLNQVSYRPEYLGRHNSYKPYVYNLVTVTPGYSIGSTPAPYSSVVKNVQESQKDHFYSDYERIPQRLRRRLNYNDDKSINAKVSHRYLYSRENNNNYFIPAERYLRPLYSLADHDHKEVKTYHKPDPSEYQQRFKTQDRRELIPRQKTPNFLNNYHNNKGEHDSSKEYNQGDNYAFSYTVKDHKTGDDFSHSQQSTGSATNGEYRVRLPDGRMQIVSYTADENGYKADVRYDELHNQDNSVDIDTSRDNRYHNDYLRNRFKSHGTNIYNGNIDSTDFSSNDEYLQHRNKGDKAHYVLDEYQKQRPTVYPDTKLDFDIHQDEFREDKVDISEHKGDLTDKNNDYLNRYNDGILESDKLERAHDTDYFHYAEDIPFSKEVKDYSSERNVEYQPHISKYSSFNDLKPVTVKPSYDELKDLFVTHYYRRNQNNDVPLTTARPIFDATTERVVVVGGNKPNLYTNIKSIAPVTPSPLSYSTPRGYLLSTIANLKSQINLGSKPVLSDNYINKINKYLTYK